MTIRDLAHLLLTAQDINREVMIVKDGCYSDITNVRFENGIFLISASGYYKDRVTVNTTIEVKSPYKEEPKIFWCMIQEEFVTLETAKLLKEKGFNEYCKDIIKEDDNRIMQSVFRTNKNLPKLCYSRPTQSVAQKWLRETKNLHIEISYMYGNYWIYDILTIPNHDLVGLSDRPIVRYNTYEEALEAGLQETLKLI